MHSVPFSKVRTKPRKKYLTKAKALVEIFEVVFLDIPPYKVRLSVMFARNFSKPFDILKKKVFMNERMHA